LRDVLDALDVLDGAALHPVALEGAKHMEPWQIVTAACVLLLGALPAYLVYVGRRP